MSNYNPDFDKGKMEKILSREHLMVLADTSFVMEYTKFKEFITNGFATMLKAHGKTIFVTYSTLLELDKHSQSNDLRKKQLAQQALVFLLSLHREELLTIVGKDTDRAFNDSMLMQAYYRFISSNHLFLLSADTALNDDYIRHYKSDGAIRFKRSLSIYDFKMLRTFYEDNLTNTSKPYTSHSDPHEKTIRKETHLRKKAPFAFHRTNTNALTVYDTQGREIVLESEIGSGASGKVFQIKNDAAHVVKVYHPNIDENQYERAVSMVTRLKALSHKQIAFPTEEVFDKNFQFVGFIMPRFSGVSLHRILNERKLSMTEKLDICHQILVLMEFVKVNGFMLPDFRLDNIIIEENNVCFIDTDGFDDPDVQNPLFAKPKHISGDPDVFSAIVLCTNILLQRHPYLGKNPTEENLKHLRFNEGGFFFHDKNFLSLSNSLRKMITNTLQHGISYKIEDWIQAFANEMQKPQKSTFLRLFGHHN